MRPLQGMATPPLLVHPRAPDSGIFSRLRTRSEPPPLTDVRFWQRNPGAMRHDFTKNYYPFVALVAPEDCTARAVRAVFAHALQACVDASTGAVALSLACCLMAAGHRQSADRLGSMYRYHVTVFAGMASACIGTALGLGLVCGVVSPLLEAVSAYLLASL